MSQRKNMKNIFNNKEKLFLLQKFGKTKNIVKNNSFAFSQKTLILVFLY